jgi:hypothetical protein
VDWIIDRVAVEFVLLAVPAYFFLQLFMALRYRGSWLMFALVPLIVMVPLVLHAILALMAGSNLWPILVILASPAAFLYLLGVAVAKIALG